MSKITREGADILARMIGEARHDWSSQAITGAVYAVVRKFGARVDAHEIRVACLIYAADESLDSPVGMSDPAGRHWVAAKDALMEDGTGRRFADRHSQKVLTDAARARQEFDLEAHARGMAETRRALAAARNRRLAVSAG